ncbi:MAG: SDR family NAD(P)-dependent oxidoreductase, partial [Verrucomicrobiales bacterium]
QIQAQVEASIQLMESFLKDRTLLASLPQDVRQAFMMNAGRLSRPDRLELMKVSKAHRRKKKRKQIAADRVSTANTIIREARLNPVFVPPSESLPPQSKDERPRLNKAKFCYVCKTPYDVLHFFYDSMCGPCGDLNYKKRFQSVPLSGRVALITGARLKIGYQSALMMLRAGARVIATTRFPHDAAMRFAREKDYSEWSHRLDVHGLDLRHSPSVEFFADYLVKNEARLDFLINNAAQTVRRPPGFYRHLLEVEGTPLKELPSEAHSILQSYESSKSPALALAGSSDWVAELAVQGAAIGIQAPALLSQLPYSPKEEAEAESAFPVGRQDADLQQVDLRKMNSWRMTLADVPTSELIEVQLV